MPPKYARDSRPYLLLATVAVLIASLFVATPAQARVPNTDQVTQYVVQGPKTVADRNKIAATGASIDAVEDGLIYVSAIPSETDAIRALGFTVTVLGPLPLQPGAKAQDFPPSDSGYHTYAETRAEIFRLESAYPDLVKVYTFGHSYEGRDLYVVKVSDHAAVDEDEPEVLFTAHQHAREHITVEMALFVLDNLTSRYATDPQVRQLVDNREIWVVPDMNPDGGEYDVATGSYRLWRKNRQPNADGSVGTDLNRNFDFQWGCCGGSSATPTSETYRGPTAGSAPEVAALQNWVRSRRVGGVQQIKTSIDFHAYSELILWPYGYTLDDTTTGLDSNQWLVYNILGQRMAQSNGYTAEQSSDLYVSDGTVTDWLWGSERVYAFAFEMYPTAAAQPIQGFYPGDEVIAAQTARNWDAVMKLADAAVCPQWVDPSQIGSCPFTVVDPGFQANQVGTPVPPVSVPLEFGKGPFTFTATGLPPGLSITPGTGVVTGVPTQVGLYNVTVQVQDAGRAATRQVTFQWGVGDTARCWAQSTDHRQHAIADFSTVRAQTFNGCLDTTTRINVTVSITHTYIGDLVVDLIAPDGTDYNLWNRSGGSTDNLNLITSIILGKPKVGVWTVQVQDQAAGDTGTLDQVVLTFP